MFNFKLDQNQVDLLKETLIDAAVSAVLHSNDLESYTAIQILHSDIDAQVDGQALKPADHIMKYTMDADTIYATVCRNTVEVSIQELANHFQVAKEDLASELLHDQATYAPLIEEYIQGQNYLLEHDLSQYND